MLSALVRSDARGLEQAVVSLLPGGFHAAPIREHGIAVHELAFDKPARRPLELARLASLIRQNRPDVVQGWMYHGNLAAMLALHLAGRRSATRLVWGIRCSDRHSAEESLQLGAVIRLGAHLSRWTDSLVANSHAGLDYHLRYGYQSPRSLVIHNGIDTTRFKPDVAARVRIRGELGLTESDFTVAHVARLHHMKDHPTFVQAMRELPSVTGLAIGTGTESLPALPNLRRLGRRADIPQLLAASDIIVSSSAYGEGFSNVIAEGMAVGLVPVATDVGDARLLAGEAGVIIPPCSSVALADAIRSLMAAGRAQLARRGTLAREMVHARFGLDAAVRKFTEFYLECVGLPSDAS
jgi:glycosyltransferase involved in cell wall biosynthesis